MLYRAKTKETNSRWIYGYFWINHYNNEHFIMQPSEKGIPDIINTPVIPATVGRNTGLKDSRGKEIWEGDIVKYFGKWDEKGSVIEPDYKPHEIVWVMGGFHAIPLDERHSLSSSAKNWKGVGHTDCEVLGNMVDNPELLEK